MKQMIITVSSPNDIKLKMSGGKGTNLFKLKKIGVPVPEFIVLGSDFFKNLLELNSVKLNYDFNLDASGNSELIIEKIKNLSISEDHYAVIQSEMVNNNIDSCFVAVRSSGLDEDSKEHSFAGMFSSFLFQKEKNQIKESILECYASAYSIRCLEYRLKNKLSVENIEMAIVIQKMVNSEVSGVLFSRNPNDLTDRESIYIESVFGQCEGLVCGAIDADQFYVNRQGEILKETISRKDFKYIPNINKGGLSKHHFDEVNANKRSLSDDQLNELKEISISIEKKYNIAIDMEWTFENNKLYVVQVRPVTTVPSLGFYDSHVNGDTAILWDNSNIVESFSGVTTPLTFSLTKAAYAIVYRETCRLMHVPEKIIKDNNDAFENMLGFVRGNVYYNLINWYRLLYLLPGFSSNKDFMETMMGVKEELSDDQQDIFNFTENVPNYSLWNKVKVLWVFVSNFFVIDKVIDKFMRNFDLIYLEYLDINFSDKSAGELKKHFERWNNTVTYNWNPPIINDCLVMIFFGTLKKITEKWIDVENSGNLQNDLLCGQGGLDSTMPTITLMKLAAKYDQDTKLRKIFEEEDVAQIIKKIYAGDYPELKIDLDEYLRNYGFRCSNEQKLEENDLYSDPSIIFESIKNYIRLKNYDTEEMFRNERKILNKAKSVVSNKLSGPKLIIYNWVLKHTRNAVKNRENLRFLRSKSFGISRRIFRSLADKFLSLELIESQEDFYYLTVTEIFDFIDGRAESYELHSIAQIRKKEFKAYRDSPEPPDRFITYGVSGKSLMDLRIVQNGDLLKGKMKVSDDPNLIYGVSCCPGVVTGKVRMAIDIKDATNLDDEILVAKRTDPGWVPLFPSCKGLIVERGSLLSHSAVIARELGLPTIVGVNGNIFDILKDGDLVELNATNGEIRILNE